MLYLAFVKTRADYVGKDLTQKSTSWWNEGDKPADIRVRGFFGTLSDSPNVFVFEADDQDSIATMLAYWPEVQFDIHPAQDLIAVFRGQGMNVETTGQ
jgi:hypothetical protein